ncbi:ABC transporter permease [Temperatibacter marinus]|uniref:ABC transporter permease n=1 Tax=Temperatibacter marinus TaxID=1456591 RepID=A0AA52EHZ7_9PROT|nr:ABC transporter permease [Temperatibacter marinus]WND02396.1 ABC transporter permease [Temperatibacter marinus]
MISRFEWAISKRYLLSRGGEGSLSVIAIIASIAIALAVATLITVMSVMNGFRLELIDKVLGYNGHILLQGYGGKITDYDQLEKEVNIHDKIIRSTAFTESQIMLMQNGRGWGAIARGYTPEKFSLEGLGFSKLLEGAFPEDPEAEGLVLGHQLAKNLGVKVGDDITMVSPNMQSTPFGSRLRYNSYPVMAVVEIGVYQFDESFVGMPIGLAQRFFSMQDQVTTIELFVENPEEVPLLKEDIQNIVGNRAYVTHWLEFNSSIVGALNTERVAMFLVVMMIIVVAVFNISSSLFMLVKDKASDIAILRTMGAKRGSILKVFIIIGLCVGGVGILAGVGLASIIISNLDSIKSGIEQMLGLNLWDPSVRFISNMRAVVVWEEVVFTISSALFLSFIATIPPALRAAKTNPISILRSE